MTTEQKQEMHRQGHLRRKARLVDQKRRPCANCGQEYPPYVMDFDHVRGEKTLDISKMNYQRSWNEVLVEIEKCDIVCELPQDSHFSTSNGQSA